ncbi:hypothetical protein OZX72_07675 [Bifidobacterium sp. ESL0769]|uniref:hypothetical protein n=1 Tax=Bifidobacterium sp. ESL0769 TaxID=2983229 RepID=UPI0023F6E485|nr:hypothetical protein [Bifidobacterium sp. ESL0769]WEV67110.1 hypothetical protein OZX72_07675 [Bifidobacterium sp. ESL0769]
MKALKRILIGLCVAATMGVAPVAANAAVNSNAVDAYPIVAAVQGDSLHNIPSNDAVLQNNPSQDATSKVTTSQLSQQNAPSQNNSAQNTPSQSAPTTPVPQGHKVPVTPIEGPNDGDAAGDNAICDQNEHIEVQQCTTGQARSAISADTALRFNWSVLAVFAVVVFAILAMTYHHETSKDKRNMYAHHCNGRFVVR